MNHRTVAIMFLICSGCAAWDVASAAPHNVIEFGGICDASAAVAFDGRHIIVGDDELPWLSVYDIAGGRLQKKIALPAQAAGQRDPNPHFSQESGALGRRF